MAKTFLYFILFILFFIKVQGQNTTFHKVFNLDKQWASRPYNVKQIDNSYYITGHVNGPGGNGIAFLKMNESGQIIQTIHHIDSSYDDLAGFSRTNLDTTLDGDFLLHFTRRLSNGQGLNKHQRVKLNKQGQIIFSNSLDTFIQLNFDCRDLGTLILDNAHGSYFTLNNYINDSVPNSGISLIKFSQGSDEIIWMKNFVKLQNEYMIQSNVLTYENGDALLIYCTFYTNLTSPINQQYSKIHINKYNSNGILIVQKTLQFSPYTFPFYGSNLINHGSELLLNYTRSIPITPSSGWSYWGLTPTIAKLDSNFNLIWQKDLNGIKYNPDNLSINRGVNDFSIANDSTAVSGCYYLENILDSISNTYLRIENRDISTGDLNWVRKIRYYDEPHNLQDPEYDIGDVELTSDGGYIFVGQLTNWDSLSANKPGYLGYVLKTNCLGFLGDPEASFNSMQNESFGVNFKNTSLMGGSYLWDFGDGTSLFTGENVGFDSTQPIFHQYSDTGKYNVSLIAYGCNGANDTLRYTIHITPEQIINPNVTNYMALGPNPVKSGESISVYVGNLPSVNSSLSFYDYQGKLVFQNKLPQSKSTYIIPLSFAVGIYQAVLRNGNDELEVEKVVVL